MARHGEGYVAEPRVPAGAGSRGPVPARRREHGWTSQNGLSCSCGRHERSARSTTSSRAWAEDAICTRIGLLLVVVAVVLLVRAAGELLRIGEVEAQETAVTILDLLLLVFIVVELLYAVRTTVTKRELVAEPFLLVGIIASIKEIVVLSVKAAEDVGQGRIFDDQIKEIAVLGVLVLLLGGTAC